MGVACSKTISSPKLALPIKLNPDKLFDEIIFALTSSSCTVFIRDIQKAQNALKDYILSSHQNRNQEVEKKQAGSVIRERRKKELCDALILRASYVKSFVLRTPNFVGVLQDNNEFIRSCKYMLWGLLVLSLISHIPEQTIINKYCQWLKTYFGSQADNQFYDSDIFQQIYGQANCENITEKEINDVLASVQSEIDVLHKINHDIQPTINKMYRFL